MPTSFTPVPSPGVADSVDRQIRRANLGRVGVLGAVGTAGLLAFAHFAGDRMGVVSAAIGIVIFLGVTALARRGYETAGGLLVVGGGLGLVVGHVLADGELGPDAYFLALPVLVASATLRPRFVVGAALASLAGLAGLALLPLDSRSLGKVELLLTALVIGSVAAGVAVLQAASFRRALALLQGSDLGKRGLQDQLAQAQKLELVGRMAGGIAHDFNNLLTVSRAAAEFARDALAPDHPVRQELDDLIDATSRGAGLTRQLLQLARKELPDPNARCTVEKVLGDLGRLLPRVLGSKVRYEAHTELALGSVVGQAVQIEQVILNLALNARDAMPSGGALTIRAYREPADAPGRVDLVALEVRDTGSGMSPDVAARLFEPFFTTKPPGVGNGLGLATSHTIVSQLGGDIRVWTEPGKGTAFTVLLPSAGAAEPTRRPALSVVTGVA